MDVAVLVRWPGGAARRLLVGRAELRQPLAQQRCGVCMTCAATFTEVVVDSIHTG
jgi:hypothetical protein